MKSVPPSNLDATAENLFSSLIPDSRWGPGFQGVGAKWFEVVVEVQGCEGRGSGGCWFGGSRLNP